MKQYLTIILAATTASLLSVTAVAKDNTTCKADASAMDSDRVNESPSEKLHTAIKASDFVGMSVDNYQKEKLGKVDNILLDMQSGRIVAIVVSSGGFLGVGNELSAVPPTALSFSENRDTLLLDTSKEKLSAAPRFKADEWPDFSQPMYSESVYRAYNRSPYFSVNKMPDVDNSARNKRDHMLTPFDQGNSQADIDTTAQIRKAILAGKNMSINASNVKVITNKGKVALRGPVKNAEEKRMIGEIANRIARAENVDNQLEIPLETSGE
jgi:hypothetical protein